MATPTMIKLASTFRALALAAILTQASIGFSAEDTESAPASVAGMKAQMETQQLTILKIYAAEDAGATFRAYVVKWKGQEVIASGFPMKMPDKKVGDSLTVMIHRIELPNQAPILQFMAMPDMPGINEFRSGSLQKSTSAVRTNAVEKTLINDARQIAAAANQFFAESGTKTVPVSKLRPYFAEGIIGRNTKIAIVTQGKPGAFTDFASTSADTLTLTEGGSFALSTATYDKTLSKNKQVLPSGAAAKDTAGGEHAIVFSVDTGEIKH